MTDRYYIGRGNALPYMVVCKDDGSYVLATRQIFWDRAHAERYAATVNQSREPIVVEMRFPLRDASWQKW